MSRRRVSVVIPAYEAERYIAEALECVLAQTGDDDEVIVVDDGSTDATATIAESFAPRVRVLREEHRGIAAAFNRGMAEARGSLIASTDADDRWLPGKLRSQLDVLESDPAIDAVFGLVHQFLSPDIAQTTAFAIPAAPLAGLCRGAMLLRRTAWDRVGEMETHWKAGEFVSWYARASDLGIRTHMLDCVVYERRIHGRNSVLREDANGEYRRLIKATLDRRRLTRQA